MEQQIQIKERKVELCDYMDMVMLICREQRYLLYGFFSFAILLHVITKDVMGIIIPLIAIGAFELYIRYRYKKSFKSRAIYQKETITNLTTDFIELMTTDGSHHSITKWDEIYKVKENKKIVNLMTSDVGGGHFFPKRRLTAEQLTQLESLIRNKINPKLFAKDNPIKYWGIGVLIQIAITGLTVLINR